MYLSNECNNVCDYCGFSMHNQIAKNLSDLEILREAGVLKKHGFNHVLLVTGESSKQVGVDYLTHALELLHAHTLPIYRSRYNPWIYPRTVPS